jgi:hypothetical protein
LRRAHLLGLLDSPRAYGLILGAFVAVVALCGPAIAEPTTEDVHTAQQALQSLGYSPGKADGMMGARTKAAFKKFQRKKGLPVTGRTGSGNDACLGLP